MRFFIIAALLALPFQFATAGEFDDGNPEFDQPAPPAYSESDIQKKIQDEMAIACQGNLCKIVGTDSQGSGWTVSFQVGYGSPVDGGGGDKIYIGGTPSSTDRSYANITVSYRNWQCSSQLRVTPSVYRFVNTYMYNMVNEDGSVKRNFSPADQTVILFYTTMLNKVESCKDSSAH